MLITKIFKITPIKPNEQDKSSMENIIVIGDQVDPVKQQIDTTKEQDKPITQIFKMTDIEPSEQDKSSMENIIVIEDQADPVKVQTKICSKKISSMIPVANETEKNYTIPMENGTNISNLVGFENIVQNQYQRKISQQRLNYAISLIFELKELKYFIIMEKRQQKIENDKKKKDEKAKKAQSKKNKDNINEESDDADDDIFKPLLEESPLQKRVDEIMKWLDSEMMNPIFKDFCISQCKCSKTPQIKPFTFMTTKNNDYFLTKPREQRRKITRMRNEIYKSSKFINKIGLSVCK